MGRGDIFYDAASIACQLGIYILGSICFAVACAQEAFHSLTGVQSAQIEYSKSTAIPVPAFQLFMFWKRSQ